MDDEKIDFMNGFESITALFDKQKILLDLNTCYILSPHLLAAAKSVGDLGPKIWNSDSSCNFCPGARSGSASSRLASLESRMKRYSMARESHFLPLPMIAMV